MTVPSPTLPLNPRFQTPQRAAWLPYEEFPFRSRFLDLDGHRIHYLDEGRGPTLLFVHAPLWLFVFRDVIRELRGRFRCVALDLPGSGLSSAAPGWTPDIAESAALVRAFVERLELRGVTLVAHDVGGAVALGAAVQHPERYRGIVLNGSFAWNLRRRHPRVARFLGIVGSAPFRWLDTSTNLLARVTTSSGGIGRHLSPAGRRAFRGPFRDRRPRRTASRLFGDALRQGAWLDALERDLADLAHLPVLLAYGEHDQGRRAGFQEHAATLFPRHESVVIADANHFPQMDAPHEVAATIARWYDDIVAHDPA